MLAVCFTICGLSSAAFTHLIVSHHIISMHESMFSSNNFLSLRLPLLRSQIHFFQDEIKMASVNPAFHLQAVIHCSSLGLRLQQAMQIVKRYSLARCKCCTSPKNASKHFIQRNRDVSQNYSQHNHIAYLFLCCH